MDSELDGFMTSNASEVGLNKIVPLETAGYWERPRSILLLALAVALPLVTNVTIADAATSPIPVDTERFMLTEQHLNHVVPPILIRNWEALRASRLPQPAYRELFALSLSRESRLNEVRPLTDKSLRTFLSFWANSPDYAASPEISISPKGRVQASWYDEGGNSLTIEFQESGAAFFVLWAEGQPLEGVRFVSDDSLFKIFEALEDNPLGWIAQV